MVNRLFGGAFAAAAVMIWFVSSQAFGAVEYDTNADFNPGYYSSSNGADSYIHYSSADYGVWTGLARENGKSYAYTSGYADAGNLKLGLNAWVVSTPANSYHSTAYMRTAASNSFTVSPGTSGLEMGAKTTLNLNVRLDGLLSGKTASWSGNGDISAEMHAGLTISGSGNELASFGAFSTLEAYEIYYPYWNYSFSSTWNDSWGISSNLASPPSHGDSYTRKETGLSTSYTENHSFDTGLLTITFEAIVGDTIDVGAYLDTLVQANNEGEAQANFDRTFGFGVNPTVQGLEIAWAVSPQAVPLPGALPLLGSGLILMMALRKRKGVGPQERS